MAWRGSRSGYADYRYGPKPTGRALPRLAGQDKKGTRVVYPPVTVRLDPRPGVAPPSELPRLPVPVRLMKPAFTESQLPEIVKIVAELLRDADTSPWGNESAVLEGLRWHILQKNWRHEEAEAEALDIIRRAFNALGRGMETRPTFEQGQRQATIARENCKHCGSDLSADDLAAGKHFCSDICASAAKALSADYFSIMQARTAAHASRLRAIERIEPRHCQHCQTEFRPAKPDAMYCSPRCSTQAFAIANGTRRQMKPCACCGMPFLPSSKTVKTCSKECGQKLLQSTIRICAWCGSDFHPANGKSKFCCSSCAAASKKDKRRKLHAQGCTTL